MSKKGKQTNKKENLEKIEKNRKIGIFGNDRKNVIYWGKNIRKIRKKPAKKLRKKRRQERVIDLEKKEKVV